MDAGKLRSTKLFSVVALLLVTTFAWTQSRIAEPFDAQLEQQVDDTVAPLVEKQQAVGYAVGLIQDGRVVLVKGYGLSDREARVPVDRTTMFRWASISKPVTAMAALQLAEDRQLDLDGDIREYVPEFDQPATITLRQLLCHQAGIRHYANGKIIPNARRYDVAHPFESVILALDEFRDSPLLFEPGRRFSYSTHGYILASAVVERAGREDFWKQVRTRIADRAGMTTFQPDYPWVDIPGRAVGYRRLGNRIVRSGNSDVSWKLGGGGFLSTIDDLALFAAAIVRRELLKPETWEEAWTPQCDASGKAHAYGLGFRVTGSGDDLRVEHSGGQQKTRTHMVALPHRGLAAVAMTNSEFAQPKVICEALLKMVSPATSSSDGP